MVMDTSILSGNLMSMKLNFVERHSEQPSAGPCSVGVSHLKFNTTYPCLFKSDM